MICLGLLLAAAVLLRAQDGEPSDGVQSIEGRDAIQAFLKKIEGPAAKARESWPGVRERFKSGLPEGATLTVVTIMKDESGATEVIDVRVDRVENGLIHGTIATPITAIAGFKEGDEYAFPEALLFDWVILNSDGTGEGNYIEEVLDEEGC